MPSVCKPDLDLSSFNSSQSLPDARSVVAFSAATGEACMAKVTADTAQATAITAAVAMMRSMRTMPS